jgi:ribosomal protein L40E
LAVSAVDIRATNAQRRPLVFSKSSNSFRKCVHCGALNFDRASCRQCERFFDLGQRDIGIMMVAK